MLRPIFVIFLLLIITLPGDTGRAAAAAPAAPAPAAPAAAAPAAPAPAASTQGVQAQDVARIVQALESVAASTTSTWNWVFVVIAALSAVLVVGVLTMSPNLRAITAGLNELSPRLRDVATQLQSTQHLIPGVMVVRAAPRITAIPPAANVVGTLITLQGNNLQPGITVEIGGQPALVRRDSETSLTVRVPEQVPQLAAGATSQVIVRVGNPDGQEYTWPNVFTVTGA